jgi:hypothetical protein
MLDIDGAVDGLAALADRRPMLSSGQISFLGLGPHTDFEAEVISDRRRPSSACRWPHLIRCAVHERRSPRFRPATVWRCTSTSTSSTFSTAAGREHRSRHRPIADSMRRDTQRATRRHTCAPAHSDRVQPTPRSSGREHHPTAPRDPRELPRVAQADAVAQATQHPATESGHDSRAIVTAIEADNRSETCIGGPTGLWPLGPSHPQCARNPGGEMERGGLVVSGLGCRPSGEEERGPRAGAWSSGARA